VWKSDRTPLIRWAVMLIVLLLGGVGMQGVAMPRRLAACQPPVERFTLTFDTVMSDGPIAPDLTAYQGVQVSLETYGNDAVTFLALDALGRDFREIYQHVR